MMQRRLTALVAVTLLSAACEPAGVTAPAPSPTDARAFVERTYPHGIPYDDALRLEPGADKILLNLLADPAMSPHRGNIVVTLGILGSPLAVQGMIAFIESGAGPLRQDDASVRMDAVMALGYAAYAAQPGHLVSPTAYLIGKLPPGTWDASVSWRLQDDASPARLLRARAIAGLGLSGQPDALDALRGLLPAGGGARGGGGGRGGGAPLSPSEEAAINEAIRANEYIAVHGMSRYYEAFPIR